MKKWFVGGSLVGTLVVALVTILLMTSVFAQGPTPAVPAQGGITADEAKATVLAANPGTQVVSIDQDNEGGTSAYEVTLDNGLEVQVDASNGAILGTDQKEAAGPDLDNIQEEVGNQDQDDGQDENGDQDNVQEEFESQADDAIETPGVEDVPGQ